MKLAGARERFDDQRGRPAYLEHEVIEEFLSFLGNVAAEARDVVDNQPSALGE